MLSCFAHLVDLQARQFAIPRVSFSDLIYEIAQEINKQFRLRDAHVLSQSGINKLVNLLKSMKSVARISLLAKSLLPPAFIFRVL